MGKKSVKLNYKTRKNSSPDGKSRVYFFCHPDDFETYFEQICNEILQKQNCTIYYKANRWDLWEEEDLETVLGQMDLFVLPVTWKFLQQEEETGSLELQFAQKNHFPILPIMYERGLEAKFNKTCGKMQILDRTASDDPTALPFEQRLEASLSSLLTDDELVSLIRKEFSARIFLSYRKKDRKLAQELMKLIHQQELFQDVAIWYDEFLVGGKRFDTSIQKAIEESDVAVFVITPHILENKNYVITHEFPWAKDSGKPILPIMMKPTVTNSLLEKFADMPDPINANSIRSVIDALSISLGKLIKMKKKNNSWHLYRIGLAYLHGIDVEKDMDHGLTLIRKSAKQKNRYAQYQLGACYDKGIGVDQDREEAIEWYKKAAEQDYKNAQVALAVLYQSDCTSEQNDEEAFKWYLKAAEGKDGDSFAQCRVGFCYEQGIGIEKDKNQAVKWYKKSADRNNSFAQGKIGYFYENGICFDKDCTKAVDYYKKAAGQGSSFAQCRLGRCYDEGIGTEKDDSLAMEWYKKSAEQGNIYAQRWLGAYFFDERKSGEPDFKKAIEWYTKAAKQGDVYACDKLGSCLRNASNRAYKVWLDYYTQLDNDKINASDQFWIGYHYERGWGTAVDIEKAREWYTAAEKNGYKKAADALKRLDDGTDKNE